MYELLYQVFGRDGRVTNKRKELKSEKAMQAFIAKQEQNANFYRIVAVACVEGK